MHRDVCRGLAFGRELEVSSGWNFVSGYFFIELFHVPAWFSFNIVTTFAWPMKLQDIAQRNNMLNFHELPSIF